MLQNAYIAFVSLRTRVLERWSRVETRFSLSSRLLGDMVLQVLQDTRSKKGNISGAKKVTWKLSFLRLFFQYFFFFFFSFEGHPPLYFAFIRIKRKIFRNKGRSSFPWKWKFVCTFPMNPRILWIKNIWKDYPSNCTIDSMLNDKIEYNSSLFRYFIYRSFRREKWLEYISVYKTIRVSYFQSYLSLSRNEQSG